MSSSDTRIDSYPTASTKEQLQTEKILFQHRPANGLPKPVLQKNQHLQYLVRNFSQGFPPRFISQDASQPWLVFWTVQCFYALGAALDPQNKQRYELHRCCVRDGLSKRIINYRCIETILACQHPDGGFGGGPGQFAHLLPTYAAVSALAVVGRSGPGGGWDQIDRCILHLLKLLSL